MPFGSLRGEKRRGNLISLADPEQYKAFIKAGGYAECSKVVGKITRMTAEFILEYQDKIGKEVEA